MTKKLSLPLQRGNTSGLLQGSIDTMKTEVVPSAKMFHEPNMEKFTAWLNALCRVPYILVTVNNGGSYFYVKRVHNSGERYFLVTIEEHSGIERDIQVIKVEDFRLNFTG